MEHNLARFMVHTSKNSTLHSDGEVCKTAVWWHWVTEDAIIDDVKQQRWRRSNTLNHVAAQPLATLQHIVFLDVRHPANRCQLIRLQSQFNQSRLWGSTAKLQCIRLLKYWLYKTSHNDNSHSAATISIWYQVVTKMDQLQNTTKWFQMKWPAASRTKQLWSRTPWKR